MKKKGNSGLLLIALISMCIIIFSSSCKKKDDGNDQDPQPMHTIDLYFQGYDSMECTIVSSGRINTQLPEGVSQVFTDSGYVWKQWVYDVSGAKECNIKLKTIHSTKIKLYGAFNEVPNGQIKMLYYYDGRYLYDLDLHTNFLININ